MNLPESHIRLDLFQEVVGCIKIAFEKNHFDPTGMIACYKRLERGTSILAIEVFADGAENQRFMYNICVTTVHDNKINCKVSVRTSPRATAKAKALDSTISSDIHRFFSLVEEDLQNRGLQNLTTCVKLPIGSEVKIEKDNSLKRFRGIFKKRNNLSKKV